MRRLIAATAGALLGAAALAGAAYDPGAEIVSVDNARLEQGDGAVLSVTATPDGRYVVFRTRASNFFADDDPDPAGRRRVGGVFRYDRSTGALALVADGDETDEETAEMLVRGAQSPSVSADGRFVAFSTGQRLVAADTNDNVDVYRRDMSVPLTSDRAAGGAYELVSAKDGGSVPPTYLRPPATPDPPPGQRSPGAEVWPGTSISADGRYVLFRTAEYRSDLPDHVLPDVEPGQVLVRDTVADRTYLQTVTTRPGGATAVGEPAGGAPGPLAISADGSTVAWVGANAPAQTLFLNGESTDPATRYYLLRRWAEGAGTRRITGLADPTDPGCGPSGTVSVDTASAQAPCDGPLSETEAGAANFLPQPPALSADGTKAAFLTGAGRRPLVSVNNTGLDLFYVDLAAGPSLKATTVELTRDGQASDRRATGPIETVTLSGDGRWLAITSTRSFFTHPALRPVGTFRVTPDVRELYVVDVGERTIERVVRGVSGADASGSVVGSAELSDDAGLAVYASDASNLFFGDGNALTDAFATVKTVPRGTAPPPSSVNQAPLPFAIGPVEESSERELLVRARRVGKKLRLRITVPEAGSLLAVARRTTRKKRASRTSAAPIVARRRAQAPRAGTLHLTLRPFERFAVRPGRRLRVRVTVAFSPPPPAVPMTRRVAAAFANPRPAGPGVKKP